MKVYEPLLYGMFTTIRHFEGSDEIEICNTIIFNFNIGLPHNLCLWMLPLIDGSSSQALDFAVHIRAAMTWPNYISYVM